MNTFTADPSLQQSLSALPGVTEVRDTHGVVLGFFAPASHELAQAYAKAAAHFDPIEMKQRKLSKEAGRTTKEVLERIQSLEK